MEPPKISVWGIKWQSVVERQSEAKWQSKESLKSERDEIERDHEVWSRRKTKFEEWEWEILRRLDVFEFERSVFWVIWTRGGLNWNRVQKTRFSVKLNRVQGLDFLWTKSSSMNLSFVPTWTKCPPQLLPRWENWVSYTRFITPKSSPLVSSC